MRHDRIDRILSSDEEIVPSSGFVGAVMDSVRREALAPPPIPFPWRRAWPGLAAGVVSLVSATIVVFTLPGSALTEESSTFAHGLSAIADSASRSRLDLVALTLLLTFGFVTLAMRFAARNGRKTAGPVQ